ncbi:MAG: hypothetical protein K8J08_08715 [Thermoanaerobaculia bacterium]|nr:hypothetical protein [Thermoanaerobaculia bacterium]
MTKRLSIALLLLLTFAATVALAAPPPPTTGKVVAVDDGSVRIALDGQKADWIKKNAFAKFKDVAAVGKIIEITDEGVLPVVITVKTKKASSFTVDQAVSFVKGQSMAGC